MNFYGAVMMTSESVTPTVSPNLYSWFIKTMNIENTNASVWVMFIAVLLCIVVPYLIGSINPAIIISKKVYHDDIRTHGSGNAGATNTQRTYGAKTAVLVFCLDLLKAGIAVLLGTFVLSREIGGAIAGLFVILGHMFPIYYKFKGGKGVACLAMVVLILSPISFLILVPLFALIVFMTKYVSLGSIIGVMFYPIVNHAFYPTNSWVTISAFLTMLLVVFMHRENIKRLMAGTESKISFKSKKNKGDGGSDKPDSSTKED